MEIQSGDELQDMLHNIKEQADEGRFEAALKTATCLVEYFNDYEISFKEGPQFELTRREYQLFMLAQLIVSDTVNARFLWKRIPAKLKQVEEGKSAIDQILQDIWKIAQNLSKRQYSEAFKQIDNLSRMLGIDSEQNNHRDTLDLL